MNAISRKIVWLIAVLMFLATAGSLQAAALWIGLDLDTLTAHCDLLIEGQITAVKDQISGQVEVRVTHVYRGSAAKENDSLLVAAGGYTKPGSQFMDTKPLEIGDQLFWFLSRGNPQGQLTKQPEVWYPLTGGAKLVLNGHVAEFSHNYDNLGSVAAETEDQFVKQGQPTVQEYRKLIQASIDDVTSFQQELKAATAAKDSKRLVELLRQRAAKTAHRTWGWDQLADDAGKALAQFHDYAALDAAMQITGLHGGGQIRSGFTTSEGLAYLLARITDPKLKSAQRIAYIGVLPGPDEMRPTISPVPRPDHYLLDFANLAVADAQDRPLSKNLMYVVDRWAQEPYLEDSARADLWDALASLKKLYDSTHDTAVQEQIEIITWHASPTMYDKLGSPCGPVISRAYLPDDHEHYQKPDGRDVIASFSIAFCFSDDRVHDLRNQPVLESSDGVAHPAAYVKTPGWDFDPSTFSMGNGSRSGFTCGIRPPADLPAGKYQLYLRFKESDKVIGQSHAVQITLDKP